MGTLDVAMILIMLVPVASGTGERVKDADRLREDGQLEAAIAAYREILDSAPGTVAAQLGAGSALMELGRPEEAIPFLREAVRFDPGAHRAWAALGLAHAAANDGIVSELREISFTLTTRIQAEDDPLLRRQEELNGRLAERDWPEEAIRCLREAVRLEPHEAKYWNDLGRALKKYHQEDLVGTAEALARAAELDPTQDESQRGLVLALVKAGRHLEAWEACLKLERTAPTDDSWLAVVMGDLALEMGDLEESERRYLRALELDPEKTFAHVGLARLHWRRGSLELSRIHEEAAIRSRPDLEAVIRGAVDQER